MHAQTRFPPLLLFGLALGGPPASKALPTAVVGQIAMDERSWARGSLPTLTFSVSIGRGSPTDKVAAFLYFSEKPEAYTSSPYPPMFVGVLTVPGSATVTIDRPPERGPVNEHSHEKFVQGALFDTVTGGLVHVTNQEYLDLTYDAPPTEYTLDFETEDDFLTPLANGRQLSTPPTFGRLVVIDSLQPTSGPQHFGPAVFDSDPAGPNALAEDQDLLVDQGNVVILQENAQQTVAGLFDKPDDAAQGGTLVFDFAAFDFTEKVEPVSIDFVDIDLGSPASTTVTLVDALDRRRVFSVPAGWTEDITREGPPGVRTLDLTSLTAQPGFLGVATATEALRYIPGEVVRIEVALGGSGAVDNLRFRREADPDTSLRGRRGKSAPLPGGPQR